MLILPHVKDIKSQHHNLTICCNAQPVSRKHFNPRFSQPQLFCLPLHSTPGDRAYFGINHWIFFFFYHVQGKKKAKDLLELAEESNLTPPTQC